jgi:23S rRNA U2552 (ribose-2'-O)-methylase RlmE/FtsJ
MFVCRVDSIEWKKSKNEKIFNLDITSVEQSANTLVNSLKRNLEKKNIESNLSREVGEVLE